MPKPRLSKNRVHTFPKGISPKVNVIAWLEFELAYFEAVVKHFNNYITWSSLQNKSIRNKMSVYSLVEVEKN